MFSGFSGNFVIKISGNDFKSNSLVKLLNKLDHNPRHDRTGASIAGRVINGMILEEMFLLKESYHNSYGRHVSKFF